MERAIDGMVPSHPIRLPDPPPTDSRSGNRLVVCQTDQRVCYLFDCATHPPALKAKQVPSKGCSDFRLALPDNQRNPLNREFIFCNRPVRFVCLQTTVSVWDIPQLSGPIRYRKTGITRLISGSEALSSPDGCECEMGCVKGRG